MLAEGAHAMANLEPNATVRLHVGKAHGGGPQFSTNKPTTKKLGKHLYTVPQPHKHTHHHLKARVSSTPPNYSLSPDTPYCRQPDKLGLTTPCLMEAPSSFIPLPVTYPLPLIGRNEAIVNYEPQHVPIVATRMVDLGSSPISISSNPLGTLRTPPSLLTSARRPSARPTECGRVFLMLIFLTPTGS